MKKWWADSASAAAIRWCGFRCGNGCSALRHTPTAWKKTSTRSTWPESIKLLQRNWIGRSTGAEVDFFIGIITDDDGKPSQKEYEGWLADRRYGGWPRKPDEEVLRIYTTRADTLFGATYMVVAPEHPFVERLTKPEQAAAVREYCQQAASKSDLDRTDLAKEKTGVFTGSYAINPVNGEAIPIWVADYVLISYGTGAIMAVPAHDTRDFEFAKEYRSADCRRGRSWGHLPSPNGRGAWGEGRRCKKPSP